VFVESDTAQNLNISELAKTVAKLQARKQRKYDLVWNFYGVL